MAVWHPSVGCILVPGVLIYIPFVKINDAVLSKIAEEEE